MIYQNLPEINDFEKGCTDLNETASQKMAHRLAEIILLCKK